MLILSSMQTATKQDKSPGVHNSKICKVFRGLYHAHVIPAGIWSFLWNPVESGRIIFGREPCQNCHSGDHLFQRNRAIPELALEWSRNGPERNPAECFFFFFFFLHV